MSRSGGERLLRSDELLRGRRREEQATPIGDERSGDGFTQINANKGEQPLLERDLEIAKQHCQPSNATHVDDPHAT